jgi:hypothetical protein
MSPKDERSDLDDMPDVQKTTESSVHHRSELRMPASKGRSCSLYWFVWSGNV